MRDFFHAYNCQNIIKEKTCFKNPHGPSCIDLIVINRPKSFQNSTVIETCLSDFHNMSLTVLKIFYEKQRPNIVKYRNYCNFDNDLFMDNVEKSMSQEYCENQSLEFEIFRMKVDCILEKHACLLKKSYLRTNQAPFIGKYNDKQIMKRSCIRTPCFSIAKSIHIEKLIMEWNLCVNLIREAKKQFFSNLNTHDVTDNKTFWKTVKPLLAEKVKTKSKITLIEKKNTKIAQIQR